ncbi:MAG TPA: glycosyltransferase family 1 protein [Bordetella sp.]
MRVGFGTTGLAHGLARGGVDGIGSYTRELGGALLSTGDMALIPAGFQAYATAETLPGAQMPADLGRFSTMALLGAFTPLACQAERALQDRIDLFHATDHLIPKFSRIPVVATLMDAIPLSNPEWVRTRLISVKNWLWRRSGHWADHVITISEYSKQEIIRYFGIDADKISVTPLGVHPRFFESFDAETKAEVLERLGLPERFFLFVGTLQPRKNLERLLDAHARLPARLRADFPLVIVGRAGWKCEELVARVEALRASGEARWMQYLPDVEARVLMQTAFALVFPSLSEGFGLPVVEAFASGLPVIASNTTSLPEVAGEAAILVNPEDADEMAQGMRQLIDNPGLVEQLRVAGMARAREFSWQACAEKTMAVYRTVLGASHQGR